MESKFKGTVGGYFLTGLVVGLMCMFTLGIAAPWAVCYAMRWICNNSTIGGKQTKFVGTGGGLFGRFIIWWLLTIITLGIYGFWAGRNMIKWIIENVETE